MRRILPSLLVVGLFCFSLMPSASAQAAGQPVLLILHDVPDDGYTYVGNPNQFGYVVLTGEGKTTVHKDGKIVISQNGVKLYETAGTSNAHDYDALNSFVYAFAAEGPYTIHAEVPFSAAIPLSADFNGYVHRPADLVAAKLFVEAPTGAVRVGNPVAFAYEVQDAAGALIPHTDALFEVRRASDSFLVFRTHTHSHEERQSLSFAFSEEGQYLVRITGFNAFPSKSGVSFAPVTQTVNVRATAAGAPAGAPTVPGNPAAMPAVQMPTSGKYVLLPTFDPATRVGPYGNIRLNALVYDPVAKLPVAHVNYEATLKSPDGRVLFSSKTLHEYDGNLEVVTQNAVIGEYSLLVKASKGDWSAWTDMRFTVIPPVVALGAGPVIVKATGLADLVSGEAKSLSFMAQTLAGTAVQHSEIEIQVLQGSGLAGTPLLINKLHTHADGKFGVDVLFPVAGTYSLVLDAETLNGEPTPSYSFDTLGKSIVIPLTVKEGPALPNVPFVEDLVPLAADGGADAPAPSFVLFAIALAGGLVIMRRRHA